MTASRESRRPGRAEVPHRRDGEVLDAADKVFYTHGYTEATIQDVADELGILKGSLYHYIDSKEDLLYRLLVELHNDGAEKVLGAVEAATDITPVQRVALFVRLQIEFNIDHLTRITVFHKDIDRLRPERREEIRHRTREHELALTKIIAAAQITPRQVDVPHVDPAVLSKMAHGTMIWLYRWYQESGRLSRQEIVDSGVVFVLRAIFGELPPDVEAAAQLNC